ncbi:MAG: hypothetical protein Q9N68_05480 [Gammaproteobacteria bacterium]|nr:hypothetical protein [Gammaproteobacteria bacterium]
MLNPFRGGLALLLLLMNSGSFAIDPRLDWFTLESAHFRLHFAAGYEKSARKTLKIAEAVHKKLSRQFLWQPLEKTPLVLSDESDSSNGYVNPFPYNRTVLWLAKPDSVNSLEEYENWLELLLIHEYTHVLHLDRVDAAPQFLRRIFGRHELLFPNRLQPAWFTEGLATWIETDREKGVGRGQSSYYAMLMRMEVEQGVKPLSQVNLPIRSWPAGTTRYLYGVHFFQFIEDKYGAKVVQKWIDLYSKNVIPFKLDATAKKLFGKNLTTLWSEFELYLQRRYQPQINKIKQAGVIKGVPLTFGGQTRQIRALGDEVYYLRENDVQPAALMRWSATEGHQVIRRVNRGSRLDLHPSAGILLMQPEVCDEYARYFDLYRIDPVSGDEHRLTHCQRYRQATWSPDGQQIVAVQLHGELNRLLLLDSEGQNPELLWQGEDRVIGSLDWSPRERCLAAAVQREGVGWNLEWFDLQSRSWSALTADDEVETEPQFSPDGRSLLFSSEHSGVYNLRRLNVASGEMTTLTNLLGGGFSPSEGASGTLYYSAFGATGFDLFQLTNAQALAHHSLSDGLLGSSTSHPTQWDEVSVGALKPYSALNSLKPRWWFPSWLFTEQRSEVGFSTSARDVLDRHRYDLELVTDLSEGGVNGSLSYAYENWLTLALSRSQQFEFDLQGVLQRVPVERFQLVLNRAHTTAQRRWNTLLGLTRRWQSDESENSLGVALLFNNGSRQRRSVSLSDGRNVRLLAESGSLLGGGQEGEAFLLDWREYLRLGGQQVLALRYLQGMAGSAAKPFQLGGEGDLSLLSLSSSDGLFNRRRYPLRGYVEGLLQLQGEQIRLLSAEWRFPLRRIERGIMLPPVGVQQLSGVLFAEAGAAWSGAERAMYHRTLGAELNADLNLFYGLDFVLRLGVAEGLDVGGGTRAYLAFDSAF